MLGYLSADIICSEKRTVFQERSLKKTVSFEEQIMFIIVYYPSNLLRNARSFKNWKIYKQLSPSSGALDIPLCRLSTGQRSFAFRGAKLWNSLNNNIKSLKCPKNFRRHYANVLLG